MAEPSLEERVSRLENQQSGWIRFFFQYMASPVAVVVIGAAFTGFLDAERREIEQLQVAQNMLPTLFSDDQYRALATKRLLDELLSDEGLRTSLDAIVRDFFNSRIELAVDQGDLETARTVYDAAAAIGGTSGQAITANVDNDTATKDTLTRYGQARPHELAALEAIADSRFDVAMTEIQQAEQIYPTLHSVSEIRQLLEAHRASLADPETQELVKQEIVESYSWQVPPRTLDRIRARPERTR